MPKVAVTRKIPEPAEEMLKAAGYEVVISPKPRTLSRDELKNFVMGAEALLTLLTDKIDGEVLDAAGHQLKVVANYAVGFDNINLAEARARGVVVTNTPGVLTESVAEETWALILAVARRIIEADQFVRSGGYQGWEPELFLGSPLFQKTLGIIGAGQIGSFVAKIGQGFSMKILYQDVRKNLEFEQAAGAQFVDLPTLLSNSDVVSLHVPLLPETRHLISTGQLSIMKKTAILINTSRGAVVHEAALVEALKSGLIAGAGLDVYENEPQLTPGLTELKNVVLTPHLGSATPEARSAMSKIVAENIISVLSGKGPVNEVK